jgi:TonB family protein
VAVLSVIPDFSEAAKAPMGGVVTIRCVVGTDGLLHDPVITKGFTEKINKRALDALAFWRLEPARNGARPVAAKIPIGFSFRPF